MALPIPIKDIKNEPSLGQSLREIVRRAADATQYQKLIGPIEIVVTLFVQSLARFNDALIHRLSVMGMIDTGNLEVRGSTTTDRLGVANRAAVGELEVFGKAYLNQSPAITGLTANRVVQTDSGGALATPAALTNGQILIGSTGAAPVAAAITGTANQISVATG